MDCDTSNIMHFSLFPLSHVIFSFSSLPLFIPLSPFAPPSIPPLDAIAFSFARFGAGTGPILLDNVACTGTEQTLTDCPNNGIGIHNCVHSEDASVRCSLNCKTELDRTPHNGGNHPVNMILYYRVYCTLQILKEAVK